MSFFYGDVKSDELKTANGLQLQGGTNNNFTLTLDTHPSFSSDYNLNFPASIGAVNQYLKINDLNGNTANLGFATVSSGTVKLNDIDTGDAQSTLTTSTGNILIKTTNDDIVLKAGTNSNVISSRIGAIEIFQVNSSGVETKTGDITSINNLKTASGLYAGTGYTELQILPGVKNHDITNTVSSGNIDFNLNTSTNVLQLNGTDNSVRVPGSLALMEGTNAINLQAHPSTASTYTLNFPTALGTQNQVLEITSVNGTTANLGFTTVSGGSGGALDDITEGDATSNLTTTTGSITVYAQNNDVNINALTSVNVLTTQQSTGIATGGLIISGGVGVAKNLNVGGNLNVTDTATLASTLDVTGDITASNDITVSGNADVTGTFNADGATTLSSSLSVSGTTTISSQLFAISNVDVTGNVNVNKSLYVTQNSDITGTLTADGATTLGSTLGVTGASTLTGDVSASSNVDVTGNVSVTKSLYVTQNADITGTLTADGATTLGSTLGVTGATTLSSTANIGGNSNITGTLDITGATTIYDNLTVEGDFNASNTFSLDQGSITVSATGTEVLDFTERSDFIISVSGTSTLTLACKNVNTIGQQGSIIITQTADTNSLSWKTSNGWYFPSATAPTLSSGTGVYDVFSYLVVDSGGSKKILVMDATNFQSY